MALSLNANFIAAARKGTCKPRYLAQVHVASATSFKFVSGPCDNISYPDSLGKVVPVTRSLDFKKRKPSTSSASLTFALDKQWEGLLNDYALKGAHVDISLGFSELVEGDFEPHAGLLVDKVRENETSVTLLCKTLEKKLCEDKVFWQWLSLHPLQVAWRILNLSGIPNSRINLTSLAPATYSSDISHFVFSRVHGGIGMFGGTHGVVATNAMAEPMKATDLLADIAQILGGSFHDDETGVIIFTKFDPLSAVVDSWLEEELTNVIIEPLYENLINKVTVNSHPYSFTSGTAGYRYSQEDATSQSDFGIVIPGGTDEDNVKELSLDTDWVAAVAQLYTAFTASVPTNGSTFDIQGWASHGFCGTAWGNTVHEQGPGNGFFSDSGYGSGSQNAEHAVSVARPIFVQIGDEIVKCTGLAVVDDAQMWAMNPELDANYAVDIPHRIRLTIASTGGRGAKSTTPASHWGISNSCKPDLVFDVTIQEWIANLLVTRFKNGGQVIRCYSGLDKYKVQRGDKVDLTLSAARYRSKGRAGLSSTTKFEVTKKAINLHATPPRLEWTLVEAAWSGAPAGSFGFSGHRAQPAAFMNTVIASSNEDFAMPHVKEGLDVKSTSTFDVTFNSGVASNVLGRAFAEETTFTLGASKDAYFAVDTLTGTIAKYEVANLAAQPTKAPHEAWMTKVVTDGTGITDTDDSIRTTTAIAGTRVHDETIGTRQTLADNWGRNFNTDFNQWSGGSAKPPDGWDVV